MPKINLSEEQEAKKAAFMRGEELSGADRDIGQEADLVAEDMVEEEPEEELVEEEPEPEEAEPEPPPEDPYASIRERLTPEQILELEDRATNSQAALAEANRRNEEAAIARQQTEQMLQMMRNQQGVQDDEQEPEDEVGQLRKELQELNQWRKQQEFQGLQTLVGDAAANVVNADPFFADPEIAKTKMGQKVKEEIAREIFTDGSVTMLNLNEKLRERVRAKKTELMSVQEALVRQYLAGKQKTKNKGVPPSSPAAPPPPSRPRRKQREPLHGLKDRKGWKALRDRAMAHLRATDAD